MNSNTLDIDTKPIRKIIGVGQQIIKNMAAKGLVTTISSNSFLDIPTAKFDEVKQTQSQISKAPFPSEYLD